MIISNSRGAIAKFFKRYFLSPNLIPVRLLSKITRKFTNKTEKQKEKENEEEQGFTGKP